MNIQTVPAAIPQPAQKYYGLDQLHMLPVYSREQFEAAGYNVPTNDPTRPVQTFAMTVDQSGNPITEGTPVVTISCWSGPANAFPRKTTYTLTGKQCLTPNPPGLRVFPAYVIAPTPATQTGPGPLSKRPNSIPPGELALMQQGLDIAVSWGMTEAQAKVAVQDRYNAQMAPFAINYNGDPRQWLTIAWDPTNTGSPLYINVGEFLQVMYAAGVGAPGYWAGILGQNPGPGTSPVWVSTQPANAPAPSPSILPPPMRDLFPNEEFSVGPLGSTQIQRTDM